MIKIAHLADVHIHNLQRHDEYGKQFDKIYKKLEDQQPDRIVISGDLFEKFVEISNEAKTLASNFLNKLSKITIVIITPGNHDIMKKNKKRLNSVYTLINIMQNPRITYIGNSGFFPDDNIIWVNYSHLEKDIEPWIDIKHTKDDSKLYIALYHDPINDSSTDTNQVFNSSKLKSISDFKKNDFVFFGDIHKLQYFRKNKSAAYCGSTIQQNFGELPEKHGYILWNIEDKDNFTSEHIHIPNEHTYINFIVGKDTDYDNLNLSNKYITEQSEIKVQWRDLSANVTYENEIKIRKYFKDTYDLLGVKIKKEPIHTDVADVEMVSESIDILNPDVHRKIFNEYLEANGYDKEFIKEILNIDDIITDRLPKEIENMGISWSIDEVWFDNFKSYGDGNRISWKNDNGIYQITGINQQGKTTILDAISYVLYGKTTTTTKREKNGDNRYINNKRTLDSCSGGAIININGELYTLIRETERKWNRKKDGITSCSTVLDYYKGTEINDDYKLTEEVRNKTQKYIENAIGEFEDFIRLVLTTADNLNDLLSMDRAVFIDSIIKDAGYDIFEKKLDEFKEYKKEISKNDIKIDIEKINNRKEEIKEERDELNEKLVGVNDDIIENEQSKPIHQNEKEKLMLTLNKIDEKLESFNVDETLEIIGDEELKIEKRKEQLKKIDSIKVELESYNPDNIKNKRDNVNKVKEIISNFNIKTANIDGEITKNTSDINTINMDIDNIINNHIKSLEDDIKDNILKISELKNEFKTELINYTTSMKEELGTIKTNRDLYKKDIDNLMEEGKKLKKTNDELENSKDCITCKRPLEGVDPRIINDSIQSNKLSMTNIKTNVRDIKEQYDKVTDQIDNYKNKLERLSKKDFSFDEDLEKTYIKYRQNKHEIYEENNEIERRIKLIQDSNLPPILKNKLSSSYNERRRINDIISDLEKEKEEIETQIEYKNDELELNKYGLVELEKEEESINKKKEAINLEEKIKADIERFENLIKEHKKDIEDYNNQLEKIEENKSINKEISVLNEKLIVIDDMISEKMEDKSKLSASSMVLDREVDDMDKSILIFNKQKKRNEILDSYLKCVHRDGLPSYLLRKSINIINQELSNLLIEVDFNLFFDEKLVLKLSHDIKSDIAQNAIESSGMERTFSAVSLKMALRKINNKSKPNFIMLDEIMGKLVDVSVDKFVLLLDTIKEQVDKLVIIEHIHPINYDYLITVQKSIEGISSLKIE
jgi:DNA repair exonuclease SbcCD nuclease subunit/DNA repair exonuclease SbcCD ATPase subunit